MRRVCGFIGMEGGQHYNTAIFSQYILLPRARINLGCSSEN